MKNEEKLVVDGKFTDLGGPYVLRLSQSLDFGKKYLLPVSGADVTLFIDDTQYKYSESSSGEYILDSINLKILPDMKIYIHIRLANGRHYQSVPASILSKSVQTNVSYAFSRDLVVQNSGIERRQDIIRLYAQILFSEDELSYLRFSVDEDFSYPEVFCGGLHRPKVCYIHKSGDSRQFEIFNSGLLRSKQVDSFLISTITDLSPVEFRGKHYFTIYQYTISQSAYTYWQGLKDLQNQEGTVFDKPPAALRGNIISLDDPEEEQVLGYFEVSSIDIFRVFVLPSDFYPQVGEDDECAPFQSFWPKSCCNCLQLENSSTFRPPWF